MTKEEIRVLAAIPYGSENAVKRHDLAMHCNMTDRQVRKAIEKLSCRERPIINLGHGYFRPTDQDMEDVVRYVRALMHRAGCILMRARDYRGWIDDTDPEQLKLKVTP